MTNKDDQAPKWMPVFVVYEALRTIHSAVSECEQGPAGEALKEGEDVWQRVGTAFARPNGEWEVFINVVPLHGRFVMRPPEPGEEPHAIPLLWR